MSIEDKKRVGIMTLYFNIKNFGGQLQAYVMWLMQEVYVR